MDKKDVKNFLAPPDATDPDDENNDCVVGDNVSIIETRPISKTKRWRVLNINKKSEMNQQDLSPLTEENTLDSQAEGE